MSKEIQTKHFHSVQICKSIVYIKSNLNNKLSLSDIAVASGCSLYHFVRVFNAFTGETPFKFISRERIAKSLQLLANTDLTIVDIALQNGFDSSSSFNKTFKKITKMTPTQFRNLSKEQAKEIVYLVNSPPKEKEIEMNFKMDLEPVFVNRNETFVYTAKKSGGAFNDIAPIAWQELMQVLPNIKHDLSKSEFLGIGTVDKSDATMVCHYRAAFSCPSKDFGSIQGLTTETIPAAKYAKFVLYGSYQNIGNAVEKAFQIITKGAYELDDAPCLENYLNDPTITPENELVTEILIPIK